MRQRRYEVSDFEWLIIEPLLPKQMIDSSSIRVHQHAANAKKGGLRKRSPPLWPQ